MPPPVVSVAGPSTSSTVSTARQPVAAPVPERAAALYRSGGERARRARRLRRRLWRLVLALVVANLLLGVIVVAFRGWDALLPGPAAVRAGGEARIVAPAFNLRAEPSTEAAWLGTVAEGDRLDVTGAPVRSGDETWWPVAGQVDGQRVEGYVRNDGVEGVAEGPLARLLDDARARVEDVVGELPRP